MADLTALFEQAVAAHQAGRLAEAEQQYNALLALAPEHPDARHNLGVLHVQRGNPAAARPLFEAVLRAHPEQGQFWLSYAESLLATGEADEAQQLLRQGRSRGLAGAAADNLQARVEAALTQQVDRAGIAHLIRSEQLDEARRLCAAQLAQFGRTPVLLQLMGEILLRQGQDAEALPWLEAACEAAPGSINAWNQRALALNHLERYSDAHTVYQRALELKPGDPEIVANLADNLNDAQLYEQSLLWLEPVVQAHPTSLAARVNLAGALIGLNRHADAIPWLKAVLDEGHRRVEPYQLYGHALAQTGEVDLAIPVLREAVQLDPKHQKAQSGLMFSLAYCARHAPEVMRAEGERYGRLLQESGAQPFTAWSGAEPPRLRVGLVSGDLGDHPVGYFLEGVLQHLPRERLTLIAYPTVPRKDALTERLKPLFDAWTSIRGLSDTEAAQRIHADGVHVLLDLSGHTAHNRLGVFARKPAPVQASWLGYFATTGVPGMDYVLGDPQVTPPDEEHHFTERVWRLPESYLCFTPPDVPLQVSPLPALQAGRVTFGCFNNLAKMGDAVVALWARVLHAVPGSLLFLKTTQLEQAAIVARTQARFAEHGIGAERLLLEGPSPRIDLLAAYGRVDIALDPFPYPGGTTSAEALWMGVPVLTRRGDRFLSHVGETVLTNAGLPDWIAADDEDYVAKVVAFASDLPRLAQLRAGLRAEVLAAPLFDAPRFARHLESALWEMWTAYRGFAGATQPAAPVVSSPSSPAARQPDQSAAQAQWKKVLALFEMGQLDDARVMAERLLADFPRTGMVWKLLGVIHDRQGNAKAALQAMTEAAKLLQGDAEVLKNIGFIEQKLGRLEASVQALQQALALNPNYADAHATLGGTLNVQGRFVLAEQHLRQALALDPQNRNGLNNLGVCLIGLERHAEACEMLQKHLAANPDDAEALNNLGIALAGLSRHEASAQALRKAIALRPGYVDALNNLGNTLNQMGRTDEAIVCLREVVAAKQDDALSHYNLATLYRDLSGYPMALASLRDALAKNPKHLPSWSGLLFVFNHVEHELAEELDAARCYGDLLGALSSPAFFSWRCDSSPSRLRVGVVSGDLRQHPVAYWIDASLRELDRSRVELIAYPTSPKRDDVTDRLRPLFADWHDVSGLSDEEAAQRIHADGVHVLLDLSGHTAYQRLGIFARKPAPVQASWLGYFATTGVPGMDYVLGDPQVTPADEEHHFTERVWRLPESYLCFTPPDVPLEVSPLPALQTGVVTFGCFNNLAKMGDAVVALWARVLHAVPGSRLFLKTRQLEQAAIVARTQARFAAHGIGAERLLLEGASPRIDLLAAYGRVDIALDPFPYPGGTTSAEALWMGVPVLTRRGDRFLSHVGETVLTNAGLPDWIAADDEDYVAKAVAFASDLPRLAQLRDGLRVQVLASPLFDAPRFARHLENALWDMWITKNERKGKT